MDEGLKCQVVRQGARKQKVCRRGLGQDLVAHSLSFKPALLTGNE